MSNVPADLRRNVTERARGRCEYCGLSQAGQEATFHIDHVVPVADGGETVFENLALACVSCSLRKGARRLVRVPETRRKIPLYNPRTSQWSDHFRWYGAFVEGMTPTGRATVAALKMNRPLIVAIREEEMHRGRHPPQVQQDDTHDPP